MTTNVLIAQARPHLLAIPGPVVGQSLVQQVQTIAVAAGAEIAIARREDGEAWLINQGPRVIRVTYTVPDPDRCSGRVGVGPTHDVVLPGMAREIGIGKGVWWHLAEAG